MKIGPTVTVKKICYGCCYKQSESYAVQGDSGCDVYCLHPSVVRKFIGDTTWNTPVWCPVGSGDIDIDDGA